MKKQITLFSSLFLIGTSFGQTAITINSTDMPVPTAPMNIDAITASNPTIASLGSNQVWDYGSNAGSSPSQITYLAETDPFFTNAGIDVYTNTSKALGANSYYNISNEFDFNTNKIEQKGLYVPAQSYGIGTSTGNNADSLIFPLQGYILPTSRTIFQFPATANSAWQSSARHAVDLNITVTSFGLNKTPGKHVYYSVQKDSIVGWGTLRVYTSTGASVPYDVLMDRRESYTLDSFYLAGAPAPAPLLSGFGITQGQKLSAAYAYNFYRKGEYNYLLRLYFGADNSYSTLQSAFIHTDNVTTATAVETPASYSTLLYPNPTNGGQLNVQILGKNAHLVSYSVMDMMGREVQVGTPDMQGFSNYRILLNDQLVNGTYFLKVKDSDNQAVVTEKFDLLR